MKAKKTSVKKALQSENPYIDWFNSLITFSGVPKEDRFESNIKRIIYSTKLPSLPKSRLKKYTVDQLEMYKQEFIEHLKGYEPMTEFWDGYIVTVLSDLEFPSYFINALGKPTSSPEITVDVLYYVVVKSDYSAEAIRFIVVNKYCTWSLEERFDEYIKAIDAYYVKFGFRK